jgi:AhpD family alkylhydroperoxidase
MQRGAFSMSHYQRREDLTLVPDLLGLAATEGRAFLTFNNSIERDDGEIPRKYRELIALGVAFTTQCAYCIDTHTRHARAHGASKQEIAEAAFVAAAVKAGGTLAHSLLALRLFDEAETPAQARSRLAE